MGDAEGVSVGAGVGAGCGSGVGARVGVAVGSAWGTAVGAEEGGSVGTGVGVGADVETLSSLESRLSLASAPATVATSIVCGGARVGQMATAHTHTCTYITASVNIQLHMYTHVGARIHAHAC